MSTGWTAPGTVPAPTDPEPSGARGSSAEPPAGPAGPQRELVTRAPIFPPRPLGVGEILGAAVRIYRIDPKLGLGVAAIVHGIAFVLITLLTGASMVPFVAELQSTVSSPELPEATTSAVSLVTTLVGSLATSLITMVAAALVTVALTRMTLQAAVDRPIDRASVTAAMRSHGLGAALVSLLAALLCSVVMLVPVALGVLPVVLLDPPWWVSVLAILTGVLIGIVAALYLFTRFSLAVPALVAEEIGMGRAIRRSFALTAGRRGLRVAGIVLLLAVVYYLAVQIVAGIFGGVAFVAYLAILLGSSMQLLWLGMIVMIVISMLGSFAATVLLAPYLASGFAALYADMRMRHESWDLELQRMLREERTVGGGA